MMRYYGGAYYSIKHAGIPTIPYTPDAPPDNMLCFRHYNPSEVSTTQYVYNSMASR